MHLYSVTVLQRSVRYQLSLYFYSHILRLPNVKEISRTEAHWYSRPVYLISKAVDVNNEDQPKGGFTGIQFNISPPRELKPIVSALRAIGVKQPEPHKVEDSWLLTAYDPSGHQIVVVGTEEIPDEPLVEKGIGSLSVFVTQMAKSRDFYLGALGLPLRAEPYEGLAVIGDRSGTALMLYQTTKANPNTPIGRNTGISFSSDDLPQCLQAIARSGGAVLAEVPAPDGQGELTSVDFTDPEGNTFTLLNEKYLTMPAPDVRAVQRAGAPLDNPLDLDLDSGPAQDSQPQEEGYVFDRDLELD